MTVNPFTSLSVVSTAPSKAAKPAASASSEGFGSMVADAMADEGDKTFASGAKASSSAAPSKPGDAPKEADLATDDTSEDAEQLDLSNAAALFSVQPQAPQPTADEAGNTDSIKTDLSADIQGVPPAGGTAVDLLQSPAPTAAAFAVASENPASIAPSVPDVGLPQTAASKSALSAVAPETSAQLTPADHDAPLPQAVDPKTALPDVDSRNTAQIASAADTNIAPAQPAAPDSAAFVTAPKNLIPGAAERPHIDGPAAAMVRKVAASELPLRAETEQTGPQTAISDTADQTPAPTYAAQAATTGLLADAPARRAGAAFKDTVSNASAGAEKTARPTATSDEAKAASPTLTVSGQAPTAQASQAASPAAATSAFAAQVQAQANAADPSLTVTTDTLPTAQSQLATQANTSATTPVIASFSGLSRATLETTVQIAAQITRQLAGRSTRFEMGLTPEGLGKVNVSMDIDASGQLTAQLAFDNPLAAADLRSRADELRGQLQDAGFKLADDALTFSQQDASSRDGGFADQRPDQNQGRAFAAASRMADDADILQPVPAWVSLSLTPRGVDMKV